MPFQTIAPERKSFTLDKSDKKYGVDPSDPTRITIRQASVRENARRAQLFAEFTTVRNPESGEVREILKLPMYDLIVMETFLTMVDCNIVDYGTGKPLFRFKNEGGGQVLNMTFQDFVRAWGLLTDDVVAEIHDKVLEVNPHWSMNPEDQHLGEES